MSNDLKSQAVKKRRGGFYFPILLVFIFSDQICDNYIFGSFSDQPINYQLFLYISFLLLQIISSPIQAGFSDFHCRKKSLVVALTFSALSLLSILLIQFLKINPLVFFVFIILAKGGLGNTLPLSWAAISDLKTGDFRFSLALSTAAIAAGFLALSLIEKFFNEKTSGIGIFLIYLVVVFICIKKFIDIRDKGKPKDESPRHFFHLVQIELKNLSLELKKPDIIFSLISFSLWQVSFYIVHQLDLDFHNQYFSNVTQVMMLGYFVGVLILRFCNKFSDYIMIKTGYWICLSSILPIFIFSLFFNNINKLIVPCYFIYNLGTAFMPASLFSIISSKRKPHEQGKVYGLIDSTNTFSILCSSLILVPFNSITINPLLVIFISFITMAVSFFPFKKLEKIHA